jgi:ATP diphosphatase
MSSALDRLIGVMALLRDPAKGCPWDIKQDFKSIAPCTLEEAYEVVEAIENDDMGHLREELGDLLLQVVFHAQMALEKGFFDFEDVAKGLADKLIERHPHVFGERKDVNSAEDVLSNWEADKAKKRKAKASGEDQPPSVLDDVSTALPAATRAVKLQKRAARVGFDWPESKDVIAKIREETDELEAEITAGTGKDAMEDELGDLFFALVNLARHLKIDPEAALRRTNRKFESRFRAIESRLHAEGQAIADVDLDTMERLWGEIKAEEKQKT